MDQDLSWDPGSTLTATEALVMVAPVFADVCHHLAGGAGDPLEARVVCSFVVTGDWRDVGLNLLSTYMEWFAFSLLGFKCVSSICP